MKKTKLPGTSIEHSRIIFGCMNLGPGWGKSAIGAEDIKNAKAAVSTALEQGITVFDHADIYQSGLCEEIFSYVLKDDSALREKIIIQTKCGIRFPGDAVKSEPPGRYDFSYDHIIRSVDGSLKRLGTDYLDVLLLHRPDPLVEPEEVARAIDELFTKGKVRFFGVSNHTAMQIQLLKHFVKQPLIVNQVEFNLLHTHMIDEGIVFNQDKPEKVFRNEGTLEYCRINNIQIQAWSPLAQGALSKDPSAPQHEQAAAKVKELAKVKGVSSEAIQIAWLLRHPGSICPVIGTHNPSRIVSACQGGNVELTREEWFDLFIAGRGSRLP